MKKDVYNLTAPQNSIWLTEQFYQGTNINNICGSMTILEKVNFEKFSKAINLFVESTDSFRIKIFMDNNAVKQCISDYIPFDLEIIDVSSDDEVTNIENEIASIPFNLIENLLFTFKLFRFPDGHGGFVVNAHHIISDSWTLGIVVNEIIRIYSCLLNNKDIDSSSNSYIDYILSEQDYLKSDKFLKDKEHWNNIFSTVPEIATIPSINADSSKNASINADRELISIDSKLLNDINSFCTENKVSSYNFFMAVFSIYLSKVSGLDDFVIGTPILNRTNFKEKHTAGMFINTIPFRISINCDASFKDFVSKIAIDSLGMLRHQKYSYQYILENLRKQDSSLPNLYKVMLSYQVTKMTDNNEVIPHNSRWTFNKSTSDDLDIHLYDFNDESSLNIAYDYRTHKYSRDDIIAIHNRILHIINQIIDDNNIVLKDIEIVTPEEKHQILYDFNDTATDYPRNKTIADIFESQAELNPNNIAISFNNQEITYAEFNKKSNQLARHLQKLGVCEKDKVVILSDKNIDLYVAIMGILKLGALYVPIDCEYPQNRIETILEDCNPKIIIVDKKYQNLVTNKNIYLLPIKNLEHYDSSNIKRKISAEDGAYIIYTSGSTGKPKGVIVPHRGVVRLVINTNYIEFKKNDKILQNIATVFDASVFAIFGAFLNGLPLYPINKDDLLDFEYFENFIKENNITIINLTVSFFNKLIDYNPKIFDKARVVLIGGETVLPKTVNILKSNTPNIKIVNVYGPTENSDLSCCHIIEKKYINKVPIGKPISNSTCYILDKNQNIQPIGIPGEIYVGGDGVAIGYLNRDDLTNEMFIPNIYGNGKLYKTGDLGCWEKNGDIQFISRIDKQVKIRGFRIELKEIENKIFDFQSIQECSVITDKSNKIIIACIGTKNNLDIKKLNEYLKKQLPFYMVPLKYIVMENLPLNINGKLDTNKLLQELSYTSNNITKPINKIQSNLISIFKKELKTKNIGINQSFFELGGDSLSAITISELIYQKYNIRISIKDLLNNLTIEELSKLIEKNTTSTSIIINKTTFQCYYPVSSAQKRMYYASSLDGENSLLYNIAGGIILDKIPDINKLEQCFKIIINRHSSLRTYFEVIDGTIVQKILENVDFKLEAKKSNSNNIDELFNNFVKPFNLNIAPLFNAKLIILNNNKSLLLLNMHHIISDGTSLSILINELCSLYNNSLELPELSIDYKDFAVWENNKLINNEFKEDEDFWVNQFDDEIPLLNMPTNYPRPNIQSFEGNSIYTTTNKNLTKHINLLSKELGITPYMLLLSAYYILLYKYTGQNDIVVGSPIIGRDNAQLSNIIGMFVNSLALRNKIDYSLTFKEFANDIKTNCLKAFEHQTYPFDELVNKLNIKRDTSRNPLFDTMFIYQNNGNATINFDGINTENYIPKSNISKFDLSLEVIPENDVLNLRFEYCTKLFDKQFINRLSKHYINILQAIVEKSDIKIADIDMLSEKEKHQILYDFNDTKVDYPKEKTVIQLFEEQAHKKPDNVAVVFENKKLTYKELNEKANQLAHFLQLNNIEQNDIIGIILDRSFETIISMLAVLKSNATYMLIDSTLPNDRILYMLNNANSSLLITSSDMKNIDFDNQLIIDEVDLNIYDNSNLNLKYNINNSFCIIYTSGSTGTPKGVELQNKSIINLVLSYKTHLNTDVCINFLSISTVSFDMFIVETFIPLLSGKTIILSNKEEQKIPTAISNLIEKYNVEFILTTPSRIELLLMNDITKNCLKKLKIIQLGGEIFTSNLYDKLNKYTNANIYNGYGPSEMTACCANKKITSTKITIGKPFCNTNIYIINKDMNLCPIGVEGEICVSGDGISKGYINNPTVTDKVFIKNPFGDGLIYKTGDIGRYNSNGEIEYVGRKDFQIKLRGLRIELSEIEKQFLNISGIKNCAVIYKEEPNNNSFLAGFFTSNKSIDISYIREELSKHLPLYMVPKYIIKLDDMPITKNGKIDLKTLKNYEFSNSEINNYVAPETELQKLFCDVWETLLHTKVGITNDIFELGADSLLAIKFKVEMLSHNIDVQYADIFKYPTVKALSEANKFTIQENLDNFDYSKINAVLEKNNITNIGHSGVTSHGYSRKRCPYNSNFL